MQAAYSSDNSLTAWGHLRITPGYTAKVQTQISPSQGTMVQLDNEFVGQDFSASLKAMSPSLLEGGLTGIFIGSYLQSITPRLAVGFEGVWQRAALNVRPETVMSYCARYKTADWVASAQYLAQGSLGGSYWRRLTDKVEAGVDCQLQFAPGMGGNGMFGGMRKEGTTTVGVKYNFLASVYRAQVDSAGKVGVVLEKRIAPPITLTFAAEIDQWKVYLPSPPTCYVVLANSCLAIPQAWSRSIYRKCARRPGGGCTTSRNDQPTTTTVLSQTRAAQHFGARQGRITPLHLQQLFYYFISEQKSLRKGFCVLG